MGGHDRILLLLQILTFHILPHSSSPPPVKVSLCSWQQLQRKLKALFPAYFQMSQIRRPASENPVLKTLVFIVFCTSLPRSSLCCGKIMPSVRYIKLHISLLVLTNAISSFMVLWWFKMLPNFMACKSLFWMPFFFFLSPSIQSDPV